MSSPNVKRKTLKKHWYRITHFYCPVCCGGETFRERVYGKKPKSYGKTHETIDHYDWCLER